MLDNSGWNLVAELPQQNDVLVEGMGFNRVVEYVHAQIGNLLENMRDDLLTERRGALPQHQVSSQGGRDGSHVLQMCMSDDTSLGEIRINIDMREGDSLSMGEAMLRAQKSSLDYFFSEAATAFWRRDFESAIDFFDRAEALGSKEAKLWKGYTMVLEAIQNEHRDDALMGLHVMAGAVIDGKNEKYLPLLKSAFELCHRSGCFSVSYNKKGELEFPMIIHYAQVFRAEESLTGKKYAASMLLWALRSYLEGSPE